MLVLFVVLAQKCDGTSQNSTGAKYRAIEELWAAVPTYPGSTEVDRGWKSQDTIAYLSKSFNCRVSLGDLGSFYLKGLPDNGWQFTGQKPVTRWFRSTGGQALTFRKGDYQLDLEYAPEELKYGWTYAILISWNG